MDKNLENTQVQEKIVTEKKSGIGKKITSFLSRFYSGFAKTFLSPSILTVVITSIAAPLAINWVNNDLKNKELQQKVITTVLDYTSKTDFSKPESLEKITIIAKMVDENHNIFGISFAQTDSTIQNLYGQISKVGIANLNQKQKEYQTKISELELKLESDTSQLPDLRNQKREIEGKLAREQKKRYRNDNTIKDLQNKLAKNDLLIGEAENTRNTYLQQIGYWNEQKKLLEKDIKTAQTDVAKLLIENRKKQDTYKEILGKKSISEDSLRRGLTNSMTQNEALRQQITDIDSLNKVLIQTKTSLENKLLDVQKKVEKLEKAYKKNTQ